MDGTAQREKSNVALSSIGGAILITTLKIVVGFWTGSLGILAEAAHSGLDLLAAVITFLAITFSSKPADKEHLYGHGKIENFSALIETILLFVTCAWIIYEAVHRLMDRTVEIDVNFWSFFVMVVSIIVDYTRSRALSKAAKKHRSQALEADALHFETDIWSSSVVILGLIFAAFNIHMADSIAALIVAMIVIYVSYSLGKRTIDELLDRAPTGLEERIITIASSMQGVEKADNIRIRNSGSQTFVDLSLHMKRTMPLEQANALVHQVEDALHAIVPNGDIVIHPEPVETTDETIAEKVRLLMSRNGLIAHDVQTYSVSGAYQVEFQLEFAKDEDFVEVHKQVDKIESDIKEQIPNVGSVVVHIEDSKEKIMESVNVTEDSHELIERITYLAFEESEITDCKILSVLEVGGKYRVSMNCAISGKLSLEEVHTVSTKLETKILAENPTVEEVHIHTEPAGKQ
jgi:cation diffusion facilitator family transporter